jgi:hypothetical protein
VNPGIHGEAATWQTTSRKPGFIGGMALGLILFMGTLRTLAVDLSNALVVFPANLSAPEKKALTMLVEEVEKRTLMRWPTMNTWPAGDAPLIVVGNRSALEQFAGPHAKELQSTHSVDGAEGFQIFKSASARTNCANLSARSIPSASTRTSRTRGNASIRCRNGTRPSR